MPAILASNPAATAAKRDRTGWDRSGIALNLLEGAAVALLPLAAYLLLRLRLMPVANLDDASIHTTYIIDPSAVYTRYGQLFNLTARLREGSRAGLLVPARLSYLAFGALPGFVVLRYVLALVAIGPAYVLLRRLFGRPAALAAGLIILSCPVIITAWGTDFPDSVSVSYLIGGFACLAISMDSRRRSWLIGSAFLFTMAIWAFATTAVLIAVFAAVYVAIRLVRDRDGLALDLATAGGTFAVGTGLLTLGSGLLLDHFDMIGTTISSVIYLDSPTQLAIWHSSNPAWAPYDSYLLVLPVVAAVWFIAAGHRLGALPASHLLVGLGFIAGMFTAAGLQFLGTVELLEQEYFSSLSWAGAVLTLALGLSALVRGPLLEHPRWAWAFPVVVVAVPLAYEVDPHVPAFGWVPVGLTVAGLIVLVAGLARFALPRLEGIPARVVAIVAVTGILGGILVLTVAPRTPHPPLAHTVADPAPAYATALGGSAARGIAVYQVDAQLPGFVGQPSYTGEQLMMWWPNSQVGVMTGIVGIFHGQYESIPGMFPALDQAGTSGVEAREPAEILLMSVEPAQFEVAVASLAAFDPLVVKTGTLHSGSLTLHLQLVYLQRYTQGHDLG